MQKVAITENGNYDFGGAMFGIRPLLWRISCGCCLSPRPRGERGGGKPIIPPQRAKGGSNNIMALDNVNKRPGLDLM